MGIGFSGVDGRSGGRREKIDRNGSLDGMGFRAYGAQQPGFPGTFRPGSLAASK